MPSWWRWLALAAAVAGLDRITKSLVEARFSPGEALPVTSYFNLVLTFNTGAAFSMLSGGAGWQRWFLATVALAAAALIVFLLRRHAADPLFCLALALILGGALGNLWDRLSLGHVVDFLDFHAAGWHWPAFNLADSAITCGAALLVWDSFRRRR